MSATTTAVIHAPHTGARAPWGVAAVIRRGLRDQRRTPLTWGGSLGAMTALVAAIWPSIQGSVDQLLRHYPPALKDAFGITELRSVEAYIDAEMLSLIIPFAVAVLGLRVVTRVVTTPEERGWLDTVLAAPVRRSALAAGAFVVSTILVAEVLAVITVMTWLAGTAAGADLSLVVLTRGMANVWPLALLLAGLATLVAGRSHRSAPVTAIASGALVAMYILDLVGKLADGMGWLRWASAFRYAGSAVRDGLLGLPR
jgi:ABC-2 type transport system permease protein